tara:strand:- start:16628 stop:17518 length:891 start_codon:yes stop_codon:yes gene_type:complete
MAGKWKTSVVVHSGEFHADDVFTVATLQLLLGPDAIEVIRTRDEIIIAEADWVCDVGGIYDPKTNRFDHHQPEAPLRDNGIPYAAFGLVWKHYGEQLCGDPDVAALIDERFVQPMDAVDNGSHAFVPKPAHPKLRIYPLDSLVRAFRVPWGEDGDVDERFLDAASFARGILEREITQARDDIIARRSVEEACQKFDGSVPIFERPLPAELFPEDTPFTVAIMPYDTSTDTWKAQAIRMSPGTFETHVRFPEAWAGMRDEELQELSGVNDAVFCHRSRTMAFAASREGALSLAAHAE